MEMMPSAAQKSASLIQEMSSLETFTWAASTYRQYQHLQTSTTAHPQRSQPAKQLQRETTQAAAEWITAHHQSHTVLFQQLI